MSDRTLVLVVAFTVGAFIVSVIEKDRKIDQTMMSSMAMCMVCMAVLLLLSSILDSIGAQ
jgi:uncharacterized membrane protein YoaK (UPF0700 family)